ncbi:MAG: 4'-phosphopantetheinyl transferase superfamily protein [Chloroflexota bacterium]
MQVTYNDIHIWLTSLDRSVDEAEELRLLLSSDEKERADRFHFLKDKIHYTVGRSVLRQLLARYIQCDPVEIQFDYNQYGKPCLASVATTGAKLPELLQFNLSHSGTLALYGFSWERSIGVDIEYMRRNVAFLDIAQGFFSPSEIQILNCQPNSQEIAKAFYNCWTRKEAYIKAHGMGLSLPLDSFDVTLAPGEAAQLLATRPDSEDAARWTLTALSVPDGYAAAIAVEGQQWELSSFSFP